MCNFNRIFLSAVLACNPFITLNASEEQAAPPPVLSTEADQIPSDSINDHLQDFRQRRNHIDSMLLALKHIIDETQQAIPFEVIQKRSQLQISNAETLYRKGNHFTGRYLMDVTYRQVQDIVIQSRIGDSTLTQHRKPGDQYRISSAGLKTDSDFKRLDISIDALMQALDRVSEEKNRQPTTRVVQDNVAQLRQNAIRLRDSNDASGAMDSLQKAYALTRSALSALREGDTLTMSLDFADKKEEYQYYLEKTESQKLVLSMLAELNPGTKKSETLQRLINSVEPLLLEGEELAALDDHDSAVTVMDKAYTRLQSGMMMALGSP